jgi:hypothetical protein
MSAAPSGRDESRVREDGVDVEIDDQGDVTITLDRTHTMLTVIRDAHRAPPLPPSDDDPRNEVFERELRFLLRMTRADSRHTEDDLLGTRDELLDRIETADDLEALFDEMIDTILSTRTIEACLEARFQTRLLAAVMSVYRPDIYVSGTLEVGQHFYGRAERQLIAEGAITDQELQRAL